jgi:hypothetical protein
VQELTWYHGSPFELTELAEGSTITQRRELAEAFSYKPSTLSYDYVGGTIRHNGAKPGILYVIDEPIVDDADVYKHPQTTMDDGVERLTKRPLKLRRISETDSRNLYIPNRIISDITDFIFVADEPRRVDAIFIPGGSDPAPPELAATLYADGFAPLIIPSGGVSVKTGKFNGAGRNTDRYDGDYKTDCEFMTDVLLKNGVPAEAIIGEDKSGYTKENATLSRKVADERGLIIKTAIVCCKTFHARAV